MILSRAKLNPYMRVTERSKGGRKGNERKKELVAVEDCMYFSRELVVRLHVKDISM